MNMQDTEVITEFLKYASPRLEYIEKAAGMEKFALSAELLARAAQMAKAKGRTNLKRLNSLKVNKTPTDTMVSYDTPLANGAYNTITNYYNDGKLFQRGVQARKENGDLAEHYFAKIKRHDGKFVPPSSKESPSKPGNDTPGASWTGTLRDWAIKHPLRSSAIAAGAAGAGSGVLGYGVGHSAGETTGAETAAQYYKLREWLNQQQLRDTNNSFLSRLANVFGAGQLNNMIG